METHPTTYKVLRSLYSLLRENF